MSNIKFIVLVKKTSEHSFPEVRKCTNGFWVWTRAKCAAEKDD